ncbi:MAG TPA: hypothetical protein DHL02_02700 [Achromobacter sp.]|nr:hypothetical protein [Achromobacter sp.]
MAAEYSLRNALVAIEDAKRKLRRLRQNDDEEVVLNVRRSLRELENAESQIQRAINELRQG